MRTLNTVIFPSASGASGVTSSTVVSEFLRGGSVQAVSTSTLAGSLQLQASNDVITDGTTTPTNWSNVGSAVSVTSGGGVWLIPRQELAYRWLRVVLTSPSGTGNIQITFYGQGY